MNYISTRGQAPNLSFKDVVLAGLASDGGLYVPEMIPSFTALEIANMANMSYRDLAYGIMAPFIGDEISETDLRSIIDGSYDSFRHSAIAPLKQLDESTWILELFQGPTLAFKDFALQFLGRLVDHILKERDEKVVVLGATSGDTGSAAIAGCQGRESMDIFILFPNGRVSEVQRRQMTTIADANVHNVAVEGTFDDCQNIVKSLFADSDYRAGQKLVAVNSINWARILAQVVYYFYAALKLGAPAREISVSVPTGNFGDIFAGYIAQRMGLPIKQLIVATNRNDILARCIATGIYGMEGVVPTISPSMDIQISSNFERLLFDLYGRDAAAIANLMQEFKEKQSITLSPEAHRELTKRFASSAVSDEETKAAIKAVYEATGELLDPHTAIGYASGQACRSDNTTPLLVLGTAHPAKFPEAVEEASGFHPALPNHLSDLFEREERFDVLANDCEAVKAYIAEHKVSC